jgi:flagellar motor switch protein FliN/FliY
MFPGQVLVSAWKHGEDLPLSSDKAQLAWGEFEVIDQRLAVRVTRMA